MPTPSYSRLLLTPMLLAAGLIVFGCEGLDRKHDPRVADVSPPNDDELETQSRPAAHYNMPDLVEKMMDTREAHIQSLMDLESAYLKSGDTVRAAWARHQRDVFVKRVEVYPYLQEGPVEQRAEVKPAESISEADATFAKAEKILREVSLIPAAGALEGNKEKAREALGMFKSILAQHPTSDKVDDAAFYCAEIYKEYLREEDPDDELSIRYYKWAMVLDPKTPHPVRFQCAVVMDFRRHERDKALELYHQVIDLEENDNQSNVRFSATRIEQLTDEVASHWRPFDKEPAGDNETDAAEPRGSDRPSGSTAGYRPKSTDRKSPTP